MNTIGTGEFGQTSEVKKPLVQDWATTRGVRHDWLMPGEDPMLASVQPVDKPTPTSREDAIQVLPAVLAAIQRRHEDGNKQIQEVEAEILRLRESFGNRQK